eukprot:5043535-Heterocapsa_arctica.AAC.1
MGEQSDNERQLAEVEKAEHNSGNNTDQETKDIYPGVSSQKRVIIRAEQLFKEDRRIRPSKSKKHLTNNCNTRLIRTLKLLKKETNIYKRSTETVI